MFLPVIKPAFRIVLRILSFILFLLTIAAAYSGRVNPDWVAFPSALTLFFPYLAIASLIVTVAWFCAGRYVTGAIGLLAIVASWGPMRNAVPMHGSKKPENPERVFSLLTYNIVHGWDQEHPDAPAGNRSFEYVLSSGADIVGLQEVVEWSGSEIPHFEEFRDSLFARYPYRAGGPDTDLKVLSRYPVRLVKQYAPADGGMSRFALYEVRMPWGKLNWINMHLNSYMLTDSERRVVRDIMSPSKTGEGLREMKGPIRRKLSESFRERAGHARQLSEIVKDINGPLIVSGDFNDVPESYAYRLMRDAGLNDAFQETTFGPTVTYNRHGFWFHLDQVFYKGGLKALSVSKNGIRSSDHYPIKAEFEYLDKE